MGISISGYNFDGPFSIDLKWAIRDQSGVYAILDCGFRGNYLIDVGESGTVKRRVHVNHERKPCWKRNCNQALKVAVLYTNEANRMRIEKEIRSRYRLPCGVI